MLRRERALVVSALSLVLVGCGTGPVASPVTFGPDVVIGVPLAATGNLAVEGAMARQGYDLWRDWVNGAHGGIQVAGVRHRVRLEYQDDTSQPDLDGQFAERMVADDGVRFLLGPYGASNVAAAAAVADRNHVPLVSANGSSSAIFSRGYRYVFGVQTPAARNLQVVFDMAAALRPRPTTVAMLSADDGFSEEVAAGALDDARARGFRVVFDQSYPNGSTSLAGLLAQAKARNPDVVVDSGHLLEAVALNKAAKDLRLAAKLLVFTVGPAVPNFVQTLGSDADYTVTGSQWTAAARYRPDYYLTSEQYVAAYRRRFGTAADPNYQVADATAAAVALERAIEQAGSLDPERVRDALASLDVMTFFGRIKFDVNGQNIYKPMMVEQIQSGRPRTVWPLELAGVPAQYPLPTWAARTGTPDPTPQPVKLPATGMPGGGP
jgi:branched-chain amino acid transport system substrate-binding protein